MTIIRLGVRVRPEAAEPALAALLELAPGGLEERAGPDAVEFGLYGSPGALPGEPVLRAWLGAALLGIDAQEVPGDWERRWHAYLQPTDVAGRTGRLRVRAPWHPPHPDPAVLDVPVDPGTAFGAGAHPTTRLCLALLLDAPPDGGLCDWGAETGVLALAAARLGYHPVVAAEHDPAALTALRANAAHAGSVAVIAADLTHTTPPWAATVTANLPRALLVGAAPRAAGDGRPPRTLIASGLLAEEADAVAAAWAGCGAEERERRELEGWAALRLEVAT